MTPARLTSAILLTTAVAVTACGPSSLIDSAKDKVAGSSSTSADGPQSGKQGGRPTSTAITPGVKQVTTKTGAGGSATTICRVTGVRNVSPAAVTVTIKADATLARAPGLVDCGGAAALVRPIAGQRSQRPATIGPFKCTPTVNGKLTSFSCLATISRQGHASYTFTLKYKG